MSRLTRYWRYRERPWIGRRLYWRLSFDALIRAAVPDIDRKLLAGLKTEPAVLIHIPKTGGTSLSSQVFSLGHLTAMALRQQDPENFDRILKFAIVREPVDRFLSAYDFIGQGGMLPMDRIFARHVFDSDVNRFVSELAAPRRGTQIMAYYHFRPQIDFVVADEQHVIVDRLIPFHDWRSGLAALGIDASAIPRKNVTPGVRTRREQLSPASIALITLLYKNDFHLFRLAERGGAIFGSAIGGAEG